MCKLYKFIYDIIPFNKIKSALIKKHLGVCEECRKNMHTEEAEIEVKAIKSWAQKEVSLWPNIVAGLQNLERSKAAPKRPIIFHPFKIWRWAVVCLLLIIASGIVFLISENFFKAISIEETLFEESTPRIDIEYAEIKGKRAIPFIYQTPNISYIWLSETKENGGLNE